MPFRNGSLSVRRYQVKGEVPATLSRTATMSIRRHGYRPIDGERGEKESAGWINPRRPLDTSFTWDEIVDGSVVFLALRRDRKVLQRALFRAQLEVLFEATRTKKGLERLTRQHRMALEEQLAAEMLKEVSPTVSFTELIWDIGSGELFIASAGRALSERITDLFTQTFDLIPVPKSPGLVGYDFMMSQGLDMQFDMANVTAHRESEGDDE